MEITETINSARQAIRQARRLHTTIGLVPTMGALHDGHFSLIRTCRQKCDFTVVSIFVNPTQFGPNEDLATYPRTFDADRTACQRLGVDMIFAPTTEQMYPSLQPTQINTQKLSSFLCGSSRPGHFPGVCTVVAKLFNIITPNIAYFGQKDAQQLAIIKKMTTDLNFPVEVVSCPTIRQADGLAVSSRNVYLDEAGRRQAGCLWRALREAEGLVMGGQRDSGRIVARMREIIEAEPDAQIEYVSVVNREFLQPIDRIDEGGLIALAVRVRGVRLIDNIMVDRPGPIA